jgi:hypothetical protein
VRFCCWFVEENREIRRGVEVSGRVFRFNQNAFTKEIFLKILGSPSHLF